MNLTFTEWTERVCVPGSSGGCFDDFGLYFFDGVQNGQELGKSDGYLGLGRAVPFESGALKGRDRGQDIVKEMFDKNMISERKFSLYLSSKGSSAVHFGAPVEQAMKDLKSMAQVTLFDDLFWAGSCDGIAFNDVRNSYGIPDMGTQFVNSGAIYSIFDSTSETIQFPADFYEPIVTKIF